jgi:hypothetical protein
LAIAEREQHLDEVSSNNPKPNGSFTNLARSDVYQFGGVGHMVEGSGTPLFGSGSLPRSETEPSSPLRQNFNNLRVNSPHLHSPHFHM